MVCNPGRANCSHDGDTTPLTCTAPFEAFGITSGIVCRTPTPRPNISFSVKQAARQAKVGAKQGRCVSEEVFQATCDEYKRVIDLPETKKILIFCQTRADVDRFAQVLEIDKTYSGDSEMEGLLYNFRHGTVRTIVATCVLGVALDVREVTHVIHAGFPKDTLAFVQEAGRAGRDIGYSRAWSTVVIPADVVYPIFPDPDYFGQAILFKTLLDDELCRRVPIQMFLDGVAVPCAMLEINVHLCDVCERHSRMTPQRSDDRTFPFGVLDEYLLPRGQ